MLHRLITPYIKRLSKGFPIIAVSGPRQSGKTTLIRSIFSDYQYYNLENPETFSLLENDPAAYIHNGTRKIIIDEVQKIPNLLSYIQVVADEQKLMGNFILSGSENLLLSEKINQSLAGRAAYVNLLPFSNQELLDSNLLHSTFAEQIYSGSYPAIYDKNILPTDYYNQYIATYVERDIKQISNISNLSLFRKFLALLAGRIGQILNISSLSNDIGISANTVESWLSILEASYLIFRLQPYYENFGKRYIKSSKLYFTDTGLACRLLGLSSAKEVQNHYLVGGLFENMMILEIKKHILNSSKTSNTYFFRDSNGNEIDLIIDAGISQIPIEIKSSSTLNNEYLKGLNYWKTLNNSKTIKKTIQNGCIVYTGNKTQNMGENHIYTWNSLEGLFETIT